MSTWIKRAGISLLMVSLLASASLATFAADPDEDSSTSSVQSELDGDVNVTSSTEEDQVSVEAAQTEVVAQISTDPLVNLMNAQVLNPTDCASPELDAYVDDILASIITDDMDTYTKVKTCYDYVVSTMHYGSHTAGLGTLVNGVTCRSIYSQYGAVEGFGAVALTTKQGMCNAYAAAFCLMVRNIGLDANLVSGSTKGAGGSYVYHEWAEITMGDVSYLFDPQLEQSLSKYAVFGDHAVFYKTYEQVGNRYRKA